MNPFSLGDRVKRTAMGAVIVALSLSAVQCKKSSTAPTKVASSNLTVKATSSTIAALNGQSLTFVNGAPAFGATLTGNVTMAIAATNATPTAALTFSNGTQNTNLTFGSCIFTPVAPFLTGFGGTVTIDPCTITVPTAGQQANGGTVNVVLTITLGTRTAVTGTLPVSIGSDGTVTVGTTVIGTVPTQNATGT